MKIISVSLALATTAVSADQAHKLSPRHRTRRMQNGGSHHGQSGGHKGPRAQHPRHTHPLKDHPNRGHHHKQAEEDDGTLSDEDLAALLEDKDDADGPQACPFCPNGLTMESDYVLPTNSRQDDPITCGQVQDFASTLVILPEPADSTFEKEECAKVQLAEIFCCPSDEELDIINEPGPEIPIEDGDEEGRLPETQEPSQEGTEFPTEPMDTETEPTALPDDVSPEATTTTTAEEMVDATTEEEEETEPTVTPGDDVHDGSDSPPIAGAKSSKANTSAAEQPSSSKSNKTMDAKAGKDDPEQHPTKKSSSSTTTSKTGKEASEKSASAKGDTEAKSGKESSTTGSKAEKKNGLSMPHKEKSSGGLSMPAKMSSAKNSSKTKTSKEASTSSAPKLGTKAASMPPIHSSMPLTAVAKSSKQTKPNDDAAPHESSSTAKSSKKKEQGDHMPPSDKSKSSKSEELHKVDIVDAKAQKTDTKAQKTDSAKAQKKEQDKSDANNNKSVFIIPLGTLEPNLLGSPGGGDDENNCNLNGFWLPPPDETRCRLQSENGGKVEKVCGTPGTVGSGGLKGFSFMDVGDGLIKGSEVVQIQGKPPEFLPLIGTYDPSRCEISAVSTTSSFAITGSVRGDEMTIRAHRSGGVTTSATALQGTYKKQEVVDLLGDDVSPDFYGFSITEQGDKGNCTVVKDDELGASYLSYSLNPTAADTAEDENENKDSCDVKVCDTISGVCEEPGTLSFFW